MRPPQFHSYLKVINSFKASLIKTNLSTTTKQGLKHVHLSPQPFTTTINSARQSNDRQSNDSITLLEGLFGIFKSIRTLHPSSGGSFRSGVNNTTSRLVQVRSLHSNHSNLIRKSPTSNRSNSNPTKSILSTSRLRSSYPIHISQKGLGTTRSFSSGGGQHYYQNIIENVPLGLRSLMNSGLDEVEWKKEVKIIRKRGLRVNKNKNNNTMKSRMVSRRDSGLEMEFRKYFGTVSSQAQDTVVDSQFTKEGRESSITLTLYLDADFNLLAQNPDFQQQLSSEFDEFDFRLFNSTPLDIMTSLHKIHSERLNRIKFSLLKAGVFDDLENSFLDIPPSTNEDVRKLKIIFGSNWKQEMVEELVGEKSVDGSGSRGIYELSGGPELIEEVELNSNNFSRIYPFSPRSSNSFTNYNHTTTSQPLELEQSYISSSFYLPSPQFENYYSGILDLNEDNLSSSSSSSSNSSNSRWSENEWEDEEDSDNSDRFETLEVESSIGQESFHNPPPPSSVHSFSSPSQSQSSSLGSGFEVGLDSGGNSNSQSSRREFELEIQSFLSNLEEVQRELEWRRAGGGRN